MDVELLIRGGTVVTHERTRRASVAIDGGQIAAIVEPGDAEPNAREVIDAGGLHVIPGVIDTHTHARDPSVDAREDFTSATAAAAAGGITTILEMPISTPSVHSPAVLERRRSIVGPKAHVDFGLYGGAAADNLGAIVPLADEGAVGFKTFRTEPPAGREREFVGLCAPKTADYRATVRRIAETGLVGAVHAEDATALRRREAELRASGTNGAASHLAWRPPEVELSSVRECLALAAEAGARIQVAHASLAATVDLVTRARNDGARATVETCPHYLFLDASALETFGPFAKTNPPFRGVDEVALLWDRLRAGEVDVVGSDHSPFLLEEKAPFREDFWPALPGVPGLEAMLPLMLTAAVDGRIDLERVVSLTSANAARIFGLEAKGRLEPGADADVVIVKLGESTRLETKRWLTRSRATAAVWDGREARARVVRTILRGATVWDEDAGLVGAIGFGRNVRPRR